MGVQLSGTLHPTHIYKMTDCSEYDVQFATEKVKDHKFETTDAGAKSCAGKVEPADTTQYVWDYKNDENKDLGLEVGAVVHNREWSYGLIKYASLVQVAVSFKAKCTFSFRDEGCVRTLKIMDDTGYTHGELDINIHAGTPCVCAIPRKEKIAVKDKVIRCPIPLSKQKPGDCAEFSTREVHSSSTEDRLTMGAVSGEGLTLTRWMDIVIEDPDKNGPKLRKLMKKYIAETPGVTEKMATKKAREIAEKNGWLDGRRNKINKLPDTVITRPY